MQPPSEPTLTREEEMMQGHRAVADLLRAMDSWDGHTRMAFFMLLITVMNALDNPEDRAYYAHARECVLDILSCVPGLVEQQADREEE
jgi:Na+-transporting NADH:ubiquinone oxidoreductase subunit NqrF